MQLRDYVLRRLLVLPVLIIGVSIVVFTLTRVGGSPIGIYLSHEMTPEEVAQIESRFNLDKPVWVQYLYWARGILQGEFGWSGVAAAPVADDFPQQAGGNHGTVHCRRLGCAVSGHFSWEPLPVPAEIACPTISRGSLP